MYRENFYEIMNQTGEKISKIVIPKNSGLGYTGDVLKEAGLELDKAQKIQKDKLRLNGLDIMLERGEDIPKLVLDYARKGEIVLGVTGDDLYDEFSKRKPNGILRVENTYDWCDCNARYGRPALCVINKSGNEKDIPIEAKAAINSKYLFTCEDYLRKGLISKGRNFLTTQYSGNVEARVAEGFADFGIEIVYSGNSLEETGLKVVDIVRLSDIVVISPLEYEETKLARTLNREYNTLKERLENPTESFTSEMLQNIDKIVSKGAEEWGELVKAFKKEGNLEVLGESADTLYVIMSMLVKRDITLQELASEMARRQS